MTDADFVDAVMRLHINAIVAAICADPDLPAERSRELADSTVDEAHKQIGRIIAYVAALNPAILMELVSRKEQD